jgi:hypothetical protein
MNTDEETLGQEKESEQKKDKEKQKMKRRALIEEQ